MSARVFQGKKNHQVNHSASFSRSFTVNKQQFGAAPKPKKERILIPVVNVEKISPVVEEPATE